MQKVKYLFLFILCLGVLSCEEIPVEIPEILEVETGKVILLEELTGVSCPNCPAGTQMVELIKERFGDNVIPVAIHGRFLAEPVTKEGYESKYDFRNPASKFLEKDYLAPWIAKPVAYFNRIRVEGSDYFGDDNRENWLARTEAALAGDQELDLTIDHTYDAASGDINISVDVNPLVDLNGDFNLSIMILGSKLKDSQKNVSEIIKDFEHNHFLLDMATEYIGDPFATQLNKGEKVTITKSYTLAEKEGKWNPEHIEIVAFVSDVSGTSKEVIQAAETKLVE